MDIMTDKEIIKKKYIDLCEASINKDISKINELLSEDYILVHMTGIHQSKADYINSNMSYSLTKFEASLLDKHKVEIQDFSVE